VYFPKVLPFRNIYLTGSELATRDWSLATSALQKKMNQSQKNLYPIPYTLYHKTGGYALLLSVVVSGLILAIGLGLLSIIEKALTLSSAGRESQIAFYAADAGSECALFWDRKHEGRLSSVFATSTSSVPPVSGIFCAGTDIASTWTILDVTANSANTSFDMTLENGACVTVVVQKTNSGRKTLVESRGHNSCSPTFPRRIERAIRASY